MGGAATGNISQSHIAGVTSVCASGQKEKDNALSYAPPLLFPVYVL
jgi:hypothetical protein